MDIFQNPIATVLSVVSKPKSKWRPVALETVELEKLASRKLRISAKETMKIAEKLYTQGYISYPRTETNIFPKELDLQGLIQNQAQDPNWGGEVIADVLGIFEFPKGDWSGPKCKAISVQKCIVIYMTQDRYKIELSRPNWLAIK